MKKVMIMAVVVLALASMAFAVTPTPTYVTVGNVTFHPTPASGPVILTAQTSGFFPSAYRLTNISIDSLADVTTADNINTIKIWDGVTLLRQVLIDNTNFPVIIPMYGISTKVPWVDFGPNTGTVTVVTQ